MSARFDSQSMILPLPSSPHWAPITVTLDMSDFRTRAYETRESTGTVAAYNRCQPWCKGLSAAGKFLFLTPIRHSQGGLRGPFAVPPCPFLALRAEGARKLVQAEGRAAMCGARALGI